VSENDRPRAPSAGRTWGLRIARVVVTAGAFAFVLSRVDLPALADAIAHVPISAFLLATVICSANLLLGTARWRALLAAYGATTYPPFLRLFQIYWIGFFYNMWLPGGVGGDVVRGVASREAFGERGTTGAMAVVFVERVLGLVGLLLVLGIAWLVHPIAGIEGVALWSVVGIGAGAIAVIGVAIGRSIARWLPRPLAGIAEKLPRIERPLPFALALLMSLGTQSVVAITGHVLVDALHPEVPLATSFVMVPLAMATAYLPFTVGGAGAREAVFQALYVRVGVSLEDATAAGLLVAAAYYLSSGIGGLIPAPPRTAAEAATTPGEPEDAAEEPR
jgi:uncharacterized membrane protein YbhN (UPF0104 family)